MTFWSDGFLNNELSRKTAVFGLRLWVVIGICVGAAIVLALFFFSLCLTSCCRRRRRRRSPSISTSSPPSKKPQKPLKQHLQDPAPTVSKDVAEIHHYNQPAAPDVRIDVGKPDYPVVLADHRRQESNNNNRHQPRPPAGPPSASTTGTASGETTGTPSSTGGGGGGGPPEVSHLGWGHWYTLRELEEATDGLAPDNVIGEGGYGIVYRGVLADNTTVAIKNLLNNRGQAEKEFKVEVEVIGRVRHKNLVRLLGYCVEGAYRMLVYEYVDNGNLEQWLHGDVGEVSPLTWDIRMNIILGTAKGLAYLHEGLEPKVVHRDIKASNILLDQHWNAKVSDFGLAKLLCSERTYVTTRVMGTFGYVAPEYASTGMLNERSDIYSFGVLIMEIVTGRSPVDYTRPPGEVNLIDWLKTMVGERRSEQVVDPKMPEKPSAKALKRILLVALRCIDPDAHKRPKMGHVIHMLEMDDLLGREERKMGGESSAAQPSKGYTREEGEQSQSAASSSVAPAQRNS